MTRLPDGAGTPFLLDQDRLSDAVVDRRAHFVPALRCCIVTGGATPGCVAATVEEGVGLGYEFITVSDAT